MMERKKKPHALKYNNPKSASSNAEGGFGRYIVPTGPQTCIYTIVEFLWDAPVRTNEWYWQSFIAIINKNLYYYTFVYVLQFVFFRIVHKTIVSTAERQPLIFTVQQYCNKLIDYTRSGLFVIISYIYAVIVIYGWKSCVR